MISQKLAQLGMATGAVMKIMPKDGSNVYGRVNANCRSCQRIARIRD